MATKIGQGTLTSGRECCGTLRVVETVQDVLALLHEDVSDIVLFTRSASATTATPLFTRIKGVVCAAGGATSHLAIVAREFDLPCLMGVEITYAGELDRTRIRIGPEGELLLEP